MSSTTRIRIAIAVVVFIVLVVSAFLDRKNIPLRNKMSSTAQQELRNSEPVSQVVGTITDIKETARAGDNFDGQPAYRVVEKVSASKGEFTAYLNMVHPKDRWLVWDLTLEDSKSQATTIVAYGRTKN